MTVPVLHAALEQNPELELTVLSNENYAEFFKPLPRTVFIGADLSKGGKHKTLPGLVKLSSQLKKNYEWDAVADLHHVLRSQTLLQLISPKKKAHLDKGRAEKKRLTRKNDKDWSPLQSTHERYADVLRALGLKVDLSEYASRNYRSLLELNGMEPIKRHIGIAPFARHEGKQLPLSRWPKIIETFAQRDYQMTVFGSPDEKELLSKYLPNTDAITFANSDSLTAELKQIAQLEAMISMDSANMHLASMVGTRVVSIWGATHPAAGFLGFGQNKLDVIQMPVSALDCRPCSVYGNKPCFRRDYACLTDLNVQDAVVSLID
jgi:ADP-heptose:LPS heptosyltransferase